MNPADMDSDGILSGRRVEEGEKLGVVSNYLDHPNGTTRHLALGQPLCDADLGL
jgi:hypothetical protein